MLQYDRNHMLSDSEEELIADALAELLTAQRAAIKQAEAIEPAESRILASLVERQRRIEALISKLFD